jgi:trehalose-6-phosphatase
MKRKEIDAILSDYDGTLCSTTSVKGGIGIVDRIPQELEQILFGISKHIPICIISSKDFAFLHRRARFASILSCVLGLETVNHRHHYNGAENSNLDCVGYQHLIAL